MAYLLLIFNLFAGSQVDNCISDVCKVVVKINSVEKFGSGHMSEAEALTWINERKNSGLWGDVNLLDIEINDAKSEKDAIDYERSGLSALNFCSKIYSMVMGYNMSKSFTTAQLNQMKVDFISAHDYIKKDCQPHAAKAAIEGITADPNKFTQEFKDLVLNEFAKAGY